MFPLEKLNARKLLFTSKMELSEEENYFYWVLSCWMIKEKRKKQRGVDFGFARYFASVKVKECFQIFFVSFSLVIENIILGKYLVNNVFTRAFEEKK